jgi:hypothetical protein
MEAEEWLAVMLGREGAHVAGHNSLADPVWEEII